MLCDHLKCISNAWVTAIKQPTIRLSYVQNRKTAPGRRYMAREFEDTLHELENLSGAKVGEDALGNACRVYDEWRLAMQTFVKTSADHLDVINATASLY